MCMRMALTPFQPIFKILVEQAKSHLTISLNKTKQFLVLFFFLNETHF
uniref:Uncharacterized protein n=1 Tax=Lepeophtheirus salmonis TaxID=72036 RepID=A0A0K2UDJ2_LEPSM